MKLDKLASTENQSIPVEDKILALNEAQIRLIKQKINQNNLYKIGFDGFKSRYEDLEGLVVPYESAIPLTYANSPKSYFFEIEKLKRKYYLPIDIIAKAKKGECSDHDIYVSRIVKHGDLMTLLNNPHYSPSFEYQETIAVISDKKVYVCSSDFEITDIQISYIRYPNKIDIEGYDDFDGTPSQTQDCELPEYLEDELLELTIMELGSNTDNPIGQVALQKAKNSE